VSDDVETWASPAQPSGTVWLHLDEAAPGEDPPAHDVSAAARMGDTLFLAADECADIEVLDRAEAGRWRRRPGPGGRIALRSLFDLPDPDDEMDIEGLAVDDGWLWIVGSHSRTRRKPKKGQPVDAAAIAKLAELKDNPNRFFLGRLPLSPLAGEGERYAVAGGEAPKIKGRRAGQLPIKPNGNVIGRALRKDPHLGPFMALAAKENGLDVEGLAVDGARVIVGLRGPVINTWTCVLEFQLKAGEGGKLKLDGDIAKRWLDLDGLGVRDLKRDGDDLLILAGPSMALDGPAAVHRWRGWASPDRGGDDLLLRPERLLDLPYGRACDHPEALALMGEDGLLVVCDSPAKRRLGEGALLADLFTLP
jgi:hypothetical protein